MATDANDWIVSVVNPSQRQHGALDTIPSPLFNQTMANPDHLYIFAYDVVKDNARLKLSTLLEEHMSRVQKSLFEGRMTLDAARHLAKKASLLIGADDSLRVYCITEKGRKLSFAYDERPMPEPHDFILL